MADRPELRALHIADPPERWRALGFEVDADGVAEVGNVDLWLGGEGPGITAWSVTGLEHDVDGLRSRPTPRAEPRSTPAVHPNGALAIDHVVVTTPDFDRTAAALEQAGLALRRIRDAGGFRQGFRRLGPAILELAEARGAPSGPAAFWGLVVVLEDLDRIHPGLTRHLGEPHPAVQPGRRIATLSEGAGMSIPIAFMDPEPAVRNGTHGE